MQKVKLPLPTSEVICSDNLAYLKTIPDNFFDSVVTDPPYGLGDEPDAMEVLKDWIEKGYHEVKAKGGFMGKSWDNFVPQPNFWKEVFRVLKPGGHLLAFGGTRTYDWMVMSLRLGGFEIRDQLMWIYGSGFPKSMNISKNIDKAAGAEIENGQITSVTGKRNNSAIDDKAGKENRTFSNNDPVINYESLPATDEAKQWDGWGTALKPAYEPICLARKPISEKRIIDNILKHGTGGINIDDCRIGFTGDKDLASATFGRGTDILGGNFVGAEHGNGLTNIEANPKGRWPANIILSHHPDCEYIGSKKVNNTCTGNGNAKKGEYSNGTVKSMRRGGAIVDRTDENGQETVDHYNCHPDCPIKIMDEQSGILTTGAMKKHYSYTNTGNSFGAPSGTVKNLYESNSGGASRFFYCAKASRSERNKGLENYGEQFYSMRPNSTTEQSDRNNMTTRLNSKSGQNTHPTVKPVKIMQYLVRLITPPGGTCLDPFNGSGTTGIGCKLERVNYIGVDNDQENVKISIARIKAWEPEQEDYDNQLKLFDFNK